MWLVTVVVAVVAIAATRLLLVPLVLKPLWAFGKGLVRGMRSGWKDAA